MCPNWRPAIETLAVVIAVFVATFVVMVRIAHLAVPLNALQSQYKDALSLISLRADKAEKLNEALSQTLRAFENAVGQTRAYEASVHAERQQGAFMRERMTELQRALLAVKDAKVEAQVVGQTRRDKEGPEPPYIPGPTRIQAASGTYEPLTVELTRRNPSTTYPFKGPSDIAGQSRRESGPTLAQNDEAVS